VETLRAGWSAAQQRLRDRRVEVLRARHRAPRMSISSVPVIGCLVGTWSRRGNTWMAELSRGGQAAGHWSVHLRHWDRHFSGWITRDRRHTGCAAWNRQGRNCAYRVRSFGQMWFSPRPGLAPA